MNTKHELLTLTAATLLLLNGCETIPSVSPSYVPPSNLMAAPDSESAYEAMEGAVSNEGIREEWLLDYAAQAEKNRLQLIGLQKYVCLVVAKKQNCG
jgi:hypothetical protein